MTVAQFYDATLNQWHNNDQISVAKANAGYVDQGKQLAGKVLQSVQSPYKGHQR